MKMIFRRLAPVALVATSACFATRSDVALLQTQMNAMRTEAARADTARREQLDRVIASLGLVRDSLGLMSARLIKMQGDVRGDLYNMGQQLIQIQALTGQSQERLQEVRASLDQRNQMEQQAPQPGTTPAAPATPAGSTSTAATPGAGVPGPNALFQLALQQLRRGSPAPAAEALQTLLQQYPNADIAPDAQFYLGEAYGQEGNAAAADSAYAVVVQKYPKSMRAPSAMYKRALYMEKQGNSTGARALLNQLIQDYPQSDEAQLARDHLRTMK